MSWRRAYPGRPVQVGPIRVERFDVDHDVPGARGYRVTTSDGVLAFTGGLRFHGHHPERSRAFADAVAGFDPRWPLYTGWLAQRGLPLRLIGCSGHASQDDLHEMYRIRPPVVVPIHTRSPYRLHPVGGTARLVVDYARAYDFAGRPLRERA